MKKRKGFVSNSSSSSFVCDLTGEVVEGYDCSLSESEMVSCVNGHTFFYDGFDEVKEWINSEDNVEGNYGLPGDICPICTRKAAVQIVARLKAEMKKLNITMEDMKE